MYFLYVFIPFGILALLFIAIFAITYEPKLNLNFNMPLIN